MVNVRDRARMKEVLSMQAANGIPQPQYAFGRFQSTGAPIMPMARPPQTPQASSIGNTDQGVNNLRATVVSNIARYPSLSPVAGANTKVKDRFPVSGLDSAQLPRHALPFEYLYQGALTTLGGASQRGKAPFTATPAEVAGSPHVGEVPFNALSYSSSPIPSPARTTWQRLLGMRANRD